MNVTFNLATLATPADLPSGFEELATFNTALSHYKIELVQLVFYSEKVVQILGIPRGEAPTEIKNQWQGVIIPYDTAYAWEVGATPPEIITNGMSSTAALGLSLIKDIRDNLKNRSEIDALYRAYIYWTNIYGDQNKDAKLELIPKISRRWVQWPFFSVLDKAA
jgi:hypothetical protein